MLGMGDVHALSIGTDWTSIIASCLIIGGAVLAIVRWWLHSIIKEMKPNGGNTGSLGDTAKRTEEVIKKVSETQDVMKAQQDAIRIQQVSIRQQLELLTTQFDDHMEDFHPWRPWHRPRRYWYIQR